MTQAVSPFYPGRPVPPGGLVGGQRAARRAVSSLVQGTQDSHADPLLIFGSPGSGRTSMLNLVTALASEADFLVVDLDLNTSVLDVEADVAAAIVMSVVIALEAAGMLADHPQRRRAWLGQCARVPVNADAADPLLLTPANRAMFHGAALVRDLNVLADHVRSSDGAGIIIRHDDVDELPLEAKSVLSTLLVHAQDAAGWSLAIAGMSRAPLQAEVPRAVELVPLTRVDIFRMAAGAAADTRTPGAPNVLSRQSAAAVADATHGTPGEVAFCLDRMWRLSSVDTAPRLELSCEILRDLLAARGAAAEAETLPLLNRIDGLDANNLFGLHFLATFEEMTEDQLNRLLEVMSLEEPDVPPDAEVDQLDLGQISVLVARMEDQGFLERHEGRFTVLRDDAIARQYLTCLVNDRGLPNLGSGQLTYTAVATYHLARTLAEKLAPSSRTIAGTAEDLQSAATEINLVDRLGTLTDPSVEQVLDLGLSSADSTFGFPELHHPCFLLALRVRSYIDSGLCILDEELAMAILVQTTTVSTDLASQAETWLSNNKDRLAAARLRVVQHGVVPIEGDRADELRAALAPSSVLATLFGAFLAEDFHQAVHYSERMLKLADRVQKQPGKRGHQLVAVAPDLRSRLIFLNAIVGKVRRATELADDVLSRAGDSPYWLDVYNSGLLCGYREEWAIGAETLADLQPREQRGVAYIYLLLHLAGLPADSSRPPSARFARVPVDQLTEVIDAQRMSFEALSGRYTPSDYLAHVHSLRAPAAIRIGAWTLATRYRDSGLATTLITQLVDSDPENRETYDADLQFVKGRGSETRAEY